MKDALLKNLHLILILYGAYGLFTIYEEQSVILEAQVAQIEPGRIKLEQSKRELGKIQSFKENLKASREKVNETVSQLEKIQKQIPSDLNDVAVQKDIDRLAQELKIPEMNSTPSNETLKGFYFEKNYVVEGRGTFLQLLIFFENLNKLERVLNVKTVDIKLSKNAGRSRFKILDFQSSIQSYKYNVNYKEKTGVESVDKGADG